MAKKRFPFTLPRFSDGTDAGLKKPVSKTVEDYDPDPELPTPLETKSEPTLEDELFERLKPLLKQYLKDHLELRERSPSWTAPNDRMISIFLDGEEISEVTINVVQRPEYEG